MWKRRRGEGGEVVFRGHTLTPMIVNPGLVPTVSQFAVQSSSRLLNEAGVDVRVRALRQVCANSEAEEGGAKRWVQQRPKRNATNGKCCDQRAPLRFISPSIIPPLSRPHKIVSKNVCK